MTGRRSGVGRSGVGPTGAAGLAGVVGGIAVLTALSRVAGFGRTAVLAGVAGRTCVADAYLTANQLPNVVFEVVAGGALAATVLPLIAGRGAGAQPSATVAGRPGRGVAGGGLDDVGAATLSALLGWVLVTLVPAAVLVALLAHPLAGALTGTGCAGETRLVSRMIVIFAAQIPLYGLSVLAAGTLQAAHRFTAAAAAPLVSTVVVTAGYLLFATRLPATGVPLPASLPRSAVVAIAGGTTAGVLALAATVVLAALRLPGIAGLRPTLRFPADRAGLAVRLAGAGLATVLAAQGAAVVFTVVANRSGPPGSLASYSYATAVYLLPAAVLTMPVTTSVLPRITVLPDPQVAADGAGWDGAGRDGAGRDGAAPGARLVVGSTAAVLLLALTGSAVLVAVAPAVGRLFDAGPGGRSSAGVGGALGWLALGVPGAAVTTHLARVAGVLRRPGAAGLLGAGGWVLAAAAAVVAGQVVAPVRLPQALGAATAAGMLGGGVLSFAGWSRLSGVPALGRVAVPGALGVLAAAAGAAAGRRVGTALLDSSAAPSWAHVLLAGVAAGAVAILVLALLVAAGTRPTGLDRLFRAGGGPGSGDRQGSGEGR